MIYTILFIATIILILGIPIYMLWISSPRVKGKEGETKIHNLLLNLPDEYFVFKDLVFKTERGTTQIDHLIVSRYGIFAIETKNYRGEIIGNDESKYWMQIIVTDVTFRKKWYKTYTYVTKNKFYNPMRQCLAHTYVIKDIVKDWPHLIVVPIVVFTGKAIINKVNSRNKVIYDHNLLHTIKSYTTTYLTDSEVKDIVNRIIAYDYREVVSDREHVHNIKNKQKDTYNKLASGICPRCGGQLVLRNGKYGSFYGCSNYPNCKYTTH